MRLAERQLGAVIVIDVAGPIRGRSVGMILAAVREHVRAGHDRIVINLEHVPSIDLGGLGALLEAYSAARAAGGVLRLAGVTGSIHDLVVITRLLTVFDTFDSVEEAAAGALAGFDERPGHETVQLSRPGLEGIQRFLRQA